MGVTNLDQLTLSTGPVVPGGVLFTGNWYFVNATTGSDGNTGAADSPLATLDRALALCTAGNNDVVVFSGTQSRTSTAGTLVWNKDKTHLIGQCASTQRGKRARISSSGSTVFSPLVSVTAEGCQFQNFGTFYGFADASAQICWSEGGDRNFYNNVEFLGFGTTEAAAHTGSRALKISKASGNKGEHTFNNCVFGVDTIARTAANYTIEFAAGTPRNYFIGCTLEGLFTGGGTSGGHVYCAAGAAIDRYVKMEDCSFYSDVKSTGSALTQAFNIAASVGGFFHLNRCSSVGITDWETTPTNQIYIDGGAPTAATTGLAVNNA